MFKGLELSLWGHSGRDWALAKEMTVARLLSLTANYFVAKNAIRVRESLLKAFEHFSKNPTENITKEQFRAISGVTWPPVWSMIPIVAHKGFVPSMQCWPWTVMLVINSLTNPVATRPQTPHNVGPITPADTGSTWFLLQIANSRGTPHFPRQVKFPNRRHCSAARAPPPATSEQSNLPPKADVPEDHPGDHRHDLRPLRHHASGVAFCGKIDFVVENFH